MRLKCPAGKLIVWPLVITASAAPVSACASWNRAPLNAISCGSISAGSFSKSANGTLNGGSDSSGSTDRSGQMVAQISATVESVLANGDLQIVGQQELHINGERTNIRVHGRVRAADISSTNTILSSRLADATIDYDGHGFVSRSAKPGIVTRIFRDLCEPATINDAEKGVWPKALWDALEESGLPLAWVPEDLGGAGATMADGFVVLRVAAPSDIAR